MLVGDVLLAVDDTPIESPEELMDLLSARGAGHTARLRLLRGAAPTELTVTIGERPGTVNAHHPGREAGRACAAPG